MKLKVTLRLVVSANSPSYEDFWDTTDMDSLIQTIICHSTMRVWIRLPMSVLHSNTFTYILYFFLMFVYIENLYNKSKSGPAILLKPL